MSKGFISYENKNNVLYATYCIAKRTGKVKTNDTKYLGRVIDKERGIYKNRERGVFTFSLDSGFGISDDFTPVLEREKLILDFGDSFLIREMLAKSGILDIVKEILPNRSDSVLSLLFYRILGTNCANIHADTWWEGTYTRILYPKAKLQSQRISELYKEIGEEQVQRKFFNGYLKLVSKTSKNGVLIDSTGLPNDVGFPLTALNVHNGVASNEMRLVLVVDRVSGMPLYFRYVAGNIVDVTTLKITLAELARYGITVDHAIVDAGYYSENNIRALQDAQIPFVVRLVVNRTVFTDLVNNYSSDLENAKNMVKYRNRIVYVKKISIDLFGCKVFAFLGLDIDNKHEQVKKYALDVLEDGKTSSEEMDAKISKFGLFALISSTEVDTKDILPLYYTRQAIEQVFDVSKNYADILPLRIHSENALRGHLLMSFIATALFLYTNQQLKGSKFTSESAFLQMRNLKCKIFETDMTICEPVKKMNDIAKHLKLQIPSILKLW